MKTYKLELTADQLKLVSQAMMAYEMACLNADVVGTIDNTNFGDTFLKISDRLEDMYQDQGITD